MSGVGAETDIDLDLERLDDWLRQTIHGYRGPVGARRFSGGQSNPTYELTTPDRRYVLRRKPIGRLLKGAHAIEREVRVLTALFDAGFPVARVHGLCLDETVIGVRFYVMDMVDGRIFWDAGFSDVRPAERRAYFDAMNATLARLHSLDVEALGLADFGRRGGYVGRQIARWTEQYLSDADAGRDPNLDRLIEWLPRHLPADGETRVVHGDYRCDNVIFHPTEPRIVAVLDWELSTLGDPLADFAYHAMMYRMPPHIIAGLKGLELKAEGLPSEADYVRDYCRRTGRAKVPDYDFHIAFNVFRLAAIYHGIKGRFLKGVAASSEAQARAEALPELAALAWDQAVRAGAH